MAACYVDASCYTHEVWVVYNVSWTCCIQCIMNLECLINCLPLMWIFFGCTEIMVRSISHNHSACWVNESTFRHTKLASEHTLTHQHILCLPLWWRCHSFFFFFCAVFSSQIKVLVLEGRHNNKPVLNLDIFAWDVFITVMTCSNAAFPIILYENYWHCVSWKE